MTGTTVEPVVRPVVKNRIAKAERNIPQPTANIDEPVKKEEQQPSELNAQTGDRKEKAASVEPVEETKAAQHKPADTEQPRISRAVLPADKTAYSGRKGISQKGTWSMGLSVGNSGGASTELGSGIPFLYVPCKHGIGINGLLSIPNDQQLVFEDGVNLLFASGQSGGRYGTPSTYLLRIICPGSLAFKVVLCRNRIDFTFAFFGCKVCGQRQKTKQKLHYLGIPLKRTGTSPDRETVYLYVSGGCMIEKCVFMGKL